MFFVKFIYIVMKDEIPLCMIPLNMHSYAAEHHYSASKYRLFFVISQLYNKDVTTAVAPGKYN